MDVVFILDTSGSIGDPSFQQVRDFVINVIIRLDVESGRIRLGVMTFRYVNVTLGTSAWYDNVATPILYNVYAVVTGGRFKIVKMEMGA